MFGREDKPTSDSPCAGRLSRHHPYGSQKRAERILNSAPTVLLEPPTGDWIEMDEWCIRFSPSLWLYIHACMNWVAVSPLTRSVLGFVIDDRTDAALNRLLEEELHPAWREVPIKTDGWEAYQRLLSAEQHEVCAKTSGKTSMAEALNCK